MYDKATISEYADFYFNFMIGEFPEDEEEYRKTANLFAYLEDSGITDGEIYMITGMVKPKKFLTIDDIPTSLWDKSLLEKGKFYFHKELQIQSPPPTWDETFPFFLEIKIRYTLDDALDYFIKRSGIRESWVNRDKEIGSIKYLLKEYKKFDFMEPIDFFLHLIDYSVSANKELNSIYDLRDQEIELAKYLEIDMANAVANGKNKVVWRT